MKKAAKIFIIIGMIFGACTILPLVFGFLALNKLKTAKSKDELIVWGVLTLLFCSLIGGILMLCLTEKDFVDAAAVEEPKEEAPTEEAPEEEKAE